VVRRPRDPGDDRRYPTEIQGHNMARHLLAMLCLLALTPTALAQSIATADVKPAAPATMFSYLATDMRVGIKNVEGTASVLLYIYTEDDYATALATTKLGQAPLKLEAAKANPAIKRELDAYMTRNDLTDSSADRIRLLTPTRITVFGRIDAIGDDYLLIGLDRDIKSDPNATSRRRRLIPKWSIGSIDLDANPVRFFTYPQRTPSKTGG
jgi:hypothetical protein